MRFRDIEIESVYDFVRNLPQLLDSITPQEIEAFKRSYEENPATVILDTDIILGKIDLDGQRLMLLGKALELDVQRASGYFQTQSFMASALGIHIQMDSPGVLDSMRLIDILMHCSKAIHELFAGHIVASVSTKERSPQDQSIRIGRDWSIIVMNEEASIRRRLQEIEESKRQPK